MKNSRIIFICFMTIILMCACGANGVNEALPEENIMGEAIEQEVGEPVMQLKFSSVEELLRAANAMKSSDGDVADLAKLTELAIPTGIPDSYELYKITASSITIGFWYLPEEYIVDKGTMLEGELSQRHILFIYPRTEESFENVVRQLHGMSGEMISDKYYASSTQVVWNEGGKPYMMYLPIDAVGANSDEVNSIKGAFATTEENLSKLCATETVVIDRND